METNTTETANIADRALGTRCCAPLTPPLSMPAAEQMAADLQLLAHPVRLQLLLLLAQQGGHVCVCDLEAALPVKQPTVSHHLRLLREAGLIDCTRHGQWAYYFLRRDAMEAVQTRVGTVLDATLVR